MLAISNNPYGESHIPYADVIDSGKLGVYRAGVLPASSAFKLTADLLFGSWRENADFVERSGKQVVAVFPRRRKKDSASVDGEIVKLERRNVVRIHHRELKVLVPKPQEDQEVTETSYSLQTENSDHPRGDDAALT